MVPQDDPHTGYQEVFPGDPAMSKHPGRAAIAYVPRLARSKRAQQMELVTSTAVIQKASQARCVTDSADAADAREWRRQWLQQRRYEGGRLTNNHRCLQTSRGPYDHRA